MYILGIAAFYHDASAALIKNGEILAAAQEERFTRVKHDSNFPTNSIRYCLKEAGINANQLDFVVFYDKPFLKFDRLIETYLAFAPKGYKSFCASFPIWFKDKLFQKSNILKSLNMEISPSVDWDKKLLFSEHHLSHASSAFFPSPYENASILTMDGVGEWTTTSIAIGSKNNIDVIKEIHFPHSLGLLYSAITSYIGFKVNSGEYKVMGLAPYGKPLYANLIKDNLIDIKDDGSFVLDMTYFDYCTNLKMTNHKFHALFGAEPRKSESLITQREMDIAASIQSVTEEIVLKIARNIRKTTLQENICLAGGVALNCVANGKLLQSNIFKNIWIQPASGDAGGSIGAALAAYHLMLNQPRKIRKNHDKMRGGYLGPEYSQSNIISALDRLGAKYKIYTESKLLKITSLALAEGKAIGWMNGRMEFGPRSLGARSIIADARSKDMQKNLNLKIKYRESFRPFAPSILNEDVSDWFDIEKESPYMLLVAEVKKTKRVKKIKKIDTLFGIDKLNSCRSIIPAVTHVDYSARIQTVTKKNNPIYYKLIKAFKDLTGCPVLVNTSFNVRGEPIVCSPEDAYKCFMGTDLDVLVIGNVFLLKEDQPKNLISSYKDKYDLD